MKNEDVVKLLIPGIIVGAILGFGLGMLAGVNPTNPIPNYIGGILCCVVPTLLNCIIVIKGAAKNLKRSISIGEAFKRVIPYVIGAALVGLFMYMAVIESLLGINSCDIPRITNAIMQAVFGILASTFFGFVAIKSYARDVKYTKRKKKK